MTSLFLNEVGKWSLSRKDMSISGTGVGTATAGAALAASIFSIKKKKKKKYPEKSGETRIGKLNNFLVNVNPFYNNPILTYCTNYGLFFFKSAGFQRISPPDPHQGLCPLDPRWGSHPQTPVLAVPLLNSFRRPWNFQEQLFVLYLGLYLRNASSRHGKWLFILELRFKPWRQPHLFYLSRLNELFIFYLGPPFYLSLQTTTRL